MEVKLESLLTITIKEENIAKLITELDFLAQIHDYQIDTLLEIREEIYKYHRE